MTIVAPITDVCPTTIERIEAGRPLPAPLRQAVVALGNFDGFHLGHQAVARRAVELAQARGVAAIVATFDPHPVRYFRPKAPPFYLTTLDQRQRLAAEAGADAFMVFHFDHVLAQATPEDFVSQWLPDVGGIVTGSDFSYGRDRLGNVHSLAELGRKRGLTAHPVAPVHTADQMVSSTRIREALRRGNCATATRLLGRPYTIESTLRLSWHFSRQPSILAAASAFGDYLRPKPGTYMVQLRRWNGSLHEGFAQIGYDDLHGVPPGDFKLVLENSARWLEGEPVEIRFERETHDIDQEL